jgi:hypothetical protein
LWHLSIYKVADKYDIPKRMKAAVFQAASLVKGALEENSKIDPCTPEIVAKLSLREVLAKIYELTGHRSYKDPLRHTILTVLVRHPATALVNVVKHGLFQANLRSIGEAIPQYAQDMILYMTSPMTWAQPPKFLAVVEELEFSHANCRKKWWKRAGLLKSYCMSCGQINYWGEIAAQCSSSA